MLRRFVTGTAIATSLALALTGCLGDTKEKAGEARDAIKLTAAQVLGKTAQKTGQIDTFTTDITVDSQLQGAAMKMHMVARTRLRPEVAMSMETDAMTVAGQTIPASEIRLIGSDMYMKNPALEASNGGKPWGRISLSGLGGAGGLNVEQMLEQAKQQSPAEQTKMFTASKNVREVGIETVEGVRTRHFTGTVPVQEALGQLDAEQRKALEETYRQMGTSEIGFDLWVGDDDLPRKVLAKVQTGPGTVITTAIYRDYGKPVDVVAPPAAETGDLKMPGMN
ncbi:hypothetical protein [Actinomadura sp. 9N407]|uniref:hypothetical protein n=1 Tax=Actinomadura sp. 9N407 TaxID=3375154 RepID=UPI0037951134